MGCSGSKPTTTTAAPQAGSAAATKKKSGVKKFDVDYKRGKTVSCVKCMSL